MTTPIDPPDDRGMQCCGKDKLEKAGFRLVGAFDAEGDKVGYLLQDPPPGSQILYAFVLDGQQVAFIGRTFQGVVADIASHFSTGPAVACGRQCDWLIRQSLEAGQTVEIYVLPEHGHLLMRGFVVNLGAAIMDNVMAAFQPPWNFLLSDLDLDSSGSALCE